MVYEQLLCQGISKDKHVLQLEKEVERYTLVLTIDNVLYV